jgi:NAD(P)-dependent dehydrogenase (short-subunit alcohol dehydrogenase family)
MKARVALVTGGTRGIGLGIARRLATERWQLAICGTRAASDVRETIVALQHDSPRVEYFQTDISQRADRARLVGEVRDAFTCVNALVNNAGRAARVRADVLDATEDSFEELVQSNLQGPYFLTQAIARDMIDRRRKEPTFAAAIVFITSVSAELASINRGDYCVSKAGLAMAAKLFAVRLANEGVPVFEVRPGIIATDMTARVKETYDTRIASGLVPEPRWGQPDDIGTVVAALLRGDFPYATGSVIHVDGGLALPRL